MNIQEASNIRRSELIDHIKSAFADTSYPGDDQIGSYEVAKFRGKWSDLPSKTIASYKIDLDYLTPQGFSYYLPSILVLILENQEVADILVEMLPYWLAPYQYEHSLKTPVLKFSEDRYNELKAVSSLLNVAQVNIIVRLISEYHNLFPNMLWEEKDRELLGYAESFWEHQLSDKSTPENNEREV